jgi:hypothetical protein
LFGEADHSRHFFYRNALILNAFSKWRLQSRQGALFLRRMSMEQGPRAKEHIRA